MARLILDTGVLVAGVRGRLDVAAVTDEDDVALPGVTQGFLSLHGVVLVAVVLRVRGPPGGEIRTSVVASGSPSGVEATCAAIVRVVNSTPPTFAVSGDVGNVEFTTH